jgi:hypothetical protein
MSYVLTNNFSIHGSTSLTNINIKSANNSSSITQGTDLTITSSSNLSLDGTSITAKKRVYQQLNTDPSYNAVNGYYGLAQDAYPALNPYSSSVQAVSTWTTRTTPVNNEWRSVCWSPELGIFVAVAEIVGTGNRVMTSPDGITWTIRTSAADNDWRSVCWSPELGIFVAVGQTGAGNRVMTSPDGSVWTIRTSAADNNWRSVCWSPQLGLFVAVAATGTGNRVMTSPDGITWNTRTSTDNNWSAVCWSPELGIFVAVAITGTGTGDRAMTSPDGITWTIRTTPADIQWVSVCWSPELGLFVAVAATGTGNRVMTSSLRGRPPTSYNVFNSSFNNIDSSGNWILKCKELSSSDSNLSVGSTFGNTEIKCNTTGVGGTISLTGGTGLLAATSGGNSGQHLVVTINGTVYKIRLETV